MTEIAVCNYSSDDVHENLALEEVLLEAVAEGKLPPLVRIWHNPKSVIMGISRSIQNDLHIEKINKDNLPLARRISGGGTVYHDHGTVSYSFHFPWNMIGYETDPRTVDSATIEPFLNIVIESLKPLGITGKRSGVSDIFIDGMKISGNAQKRVKNAILHHGTILLDVDLKAMSSYLKVPPERADIPHENFVTSLSGLDLKIDQDDFQSLVWDYLTDLSHEIFELDLKRDFTHLLIRASELAKTNYDVHDWVYRRL